jgi:hypothetical protein
MGGQLLSQPELISIRDLKEAGRFHFGALVVAMTVLFDCRVTPVMEATWNCPKREGGQGTLTRRPTMTPLAGTQRWGGHRPAMNWRVAYRRRARAQSAEKLLGAQIHQSNQRSSLAGRRNAPQ